MSDHIDVLREAVFQHEKANLLLELNDKMYHEIIGSVVYIMKYAERNNIRLPNKENLYNIVKRAEQQYDSIYETSNRKFFPDQPKGNRKNNHRRGNRTCFRVLLRYG